MKLLNRDPELSILMLGGSTATSGATGRNGGHCKTGDWKQVKDWVELYGEHDALKIGELEQDSTGDMAKFVHEYNVSSGWQDVETAHLYFKENHESALEVLQYQCELAERRPNDVPQVCAMLEVSLERGLNLQTNTMAHRLVQLDDDSQSWAVQTDRGTVRGSKVVLATNDFTPAYILASPTRTFRAYAESNLGCPPSADTSQNPVCRRSHSYPDFPASGDYIVVRQPGDVGAGDVIYGGGSSFEPNRERNITDDSVLNERVRDHLRDVGRVTFGHKNWGDERAYVHDWVGITCYTPDGFPLVGSVPGNHGLYASVCMNGHPMAWAFHAGEALVQMMTEGEARTWFPDALRAVRAWE